MLSPPKTASYPGREVYGAIASALRPPGTTVADVDLVHDNGKVFVLDEDWALAIVLDWRDAVHGDLADGPVLLTDNFGRVIILSASTKSA
ncbi:hypothetical protein ACRYCC_42715 [Actinomadura scrupuli]|uniref:hypothetical protein n=1 Tax=Actinomadura scrupuli TaxID=559629 RepID=UPI003D96E6E4